MARAGSLCFRSTFLDLSLMKKSPLFRDLIDALDGELDKCAQSHDALLDPYEGWKDSFPVESRDPTTGSVGKKDYPRRLGSPASLGSRWSEDPLPALAARLVEAGGSSACLTRASDALTAFGQLVVAYEQGTYAETPISDWRRIVEDQYKKAENAVNAAKAAIKTWAETTARSAPDSSVLNGKELIFAETLAEMLNIKIDAARKLISGGTYGEAVRIGKHKALFRADFDAALRAQQNPKASAKTASPESSLSDLPRTRHGRGRRAAKKPAE
jgi:hypothetical protein